MHNSPRSKPKNLQGRFCTEAWNTVTIISNGDVFSCTCASWTNKVIGNLIKDNISDIYARSQELRDIRNSTLDGSYGWCRQDDCSNLMRLPSCGADPLQEFNIDPYMRLPTNLSLAIDRNCNLKCPSCRATKIFEDRADPVVELMLNKLHDDYKNFDKPVSVMLDGDGDVFVSQAYDDFLFNGKLLENWKLMVTTNGNLVTKKHRQIASIAKQIDVVIVSLDAATPETYSVIRGGNFGVVIDGIKMMLDMGIQVHLQYVLQQGNYHELLLYKKLADELGVDYGLQKIDRRPHMTQDYWKSVRMEHNPSIDMSELRKQLMILKDDPKCNPDGGIQWLLSNLNS